MIMPRLAVLLVLTLPFARICTACSCAPSIPGQENLKTQADIKASDIVFRGELIAHRGGMAIFRVHEQWKGNLGTRGQTGMASRRQGRLQRLLAG